MRLSLHALLPIVLASAAGAQSIQGTPGPDYLPGTNVADGIHDGGGTGDVVHDGADPGKSDGVCDAIFTEDGLTDDICCGPEDIVFADDNDWITVRDVNGKTLFKGKFKVYFFLRCLIWDIKFWLSDLGYTFSAAWDALQDLFAANTDGELDPAFLAAGQVLEDLEAGIDVYDGPVWPDEPSWGDDDDDESGG